MSFVERRNELMKEIAGAFSSEMKSASSDLEFTSLSYMGIDCNTTGKSDACFYCLQRYKHVDFINDPKNKDAIDKIKKTSCRGSCVCSAKSVNNSSTITLDSLANIKSDDIDPQKIADQVYDAMVTKYGPSSQSMDKNDLVNLIVKIKTDVTQHINQSLNSIQMVSMEGPGSHVEDIHQSTLINAVMKSISDVCSEDKSSSTCSLSEIDGLVQNQMDYIRKDVDDKFKFSIGKVFQNMKRYLLLTGLFLLFLITVIVVLLIRKALHPVGS